MNIMITGGAGFVGTNLTARYLSQGHKVISVDNFFTGSERNIRIFDANPNYSFIQHDITKPFKLDKSIQLDRIYNLACPASPKWYQKDPVYTWKVSVVGIMNMWDLAEVHGAKLLQASTSEVYGDPKEHPQKETYWGNVNPIGPRSCYDEGKRAAETFLMDNFLQYKKNIKIIRIFNTYGPYMSNEDGRVISNFITQALQGQNITIYGDGSQTRSFQYIDDLIEAMMLMMETPDEFVGPVNLGNPQEFTILELAQKVLTKIHSQSKLVFEPLPMNDPTQRRPDITLAKQNLGWEPKINLDQGLDKTIQYFRNSNLSI